MAAGDLAKRAVVLATWISLGVVIKLSQHHARHLRYNLLCPIIVVSVAKLACSLALYRLHDGPLATIPARLREAPGVVLRYSVVSGLFCLYDVLCFANLRHFDPQSFLVFMQLRTVVTGLVWEVAFDRPLAWAQRCGLVLICAGCAAKQTGGSIDLQAVARASPAAYASLAVQIMANVCAGVFNELLLKGKGGVPLNLQNMVQYSWTVAWCVAVGTLCPLEGIHLNLLDLDEWAKMLDPHMLPNIVVLTVLGLVTSVLLKLLDSVWKAIATAVELFLTSYASSLLFGYPVRAGDLVALCIAASGIGLYSQARPAVAPPPQKGS